MSLQVAEFTEKLIPISDFSQGKAGKIFRDVADNNNEYIVLRNNRPTAVVVSVQEYKETQHKLAMLEKLLDKIEDMRLLNLAESRQGAETILFKDFISEEGFTIDELEKLSESNPG